MVPEGATVWFDNDDHDHVRIIGYEMAGRVFIAWCDGPRIGCDEYESVAAATFALVD